jgi:hypothetical protein
VATNGETIHWPPPLNGHANPFNKSPDSAAAAPLFGASAREINRQTAVAGNLHVKSGK